MNHQISLASILSSLALALLLPGCAGTKVVKVAPGDRSTPGYRYRLPQPFLLVTPKPDGTMKVEQVYLPDNANEYAVTTRSFLSKHKFQIDIEDGLLKQVITNKDTAAIASQIAGSAGTLGTEVIKTQAAQRKTKAAAIASAKKAEQAAQLALQLAQAELSAAKGVGTPNDTAIAAAQLKVDKANITLDFAREALNASSLNAKTNGSILTSPAQVLYRVVDTGDSVKLIAVDYKIAGESSTQPALPTSSKIKATQLRAKTYTGHQGIRGNSTGHQRTA